MCEDEIQLSTKSYFKDDLTSAINRLLVLNPNVIFNEGDPESLTPKVCYSGLFGNRCSLYV